MEFIYNGIALFLTRAKKKLFNIFRLRTKSSGIIAYDGMHAYFARRKSLDKSKILRLYFLFFTIHWLVDYILRMYFLIHSVTRAEI